MQAAGVQHPRQSLQLAQFRLRHPFLVQFRRPDHPVQFFPDGGGSKHDTGQLDSKKRILGPSAVLLEFCLRTDAGPKNAL